jgi:hypothetical protein
VRYTTFICTQKAHHTTHHHTTIWHHTTAIHPNTHTLQYILYHTESSPIHRHTTFIIESSPTMKLTFKDLKQQRFTIEAEPTETIGSVKAQDRGEGLHRLHDLQAQGCTQTRRASCDSCPDLFHTRSSSCACIPAWQRPGSAACDTFPSTRRRFIKLQ